jgi:hypothetical protein
METTKIDPFVLENYKGEDVLIVDKNDLNDLLKTDSFKKIIAYYQSVQNKNGRDFITDMNSLLRHGRAVGNSTRQADKIIQLLFDYRGQWIPVIDHAVYDHPINERAEISKYLVIKIKERLNNEHRWKNIASTLRHQIVSDKIDTYIVRSSYFLPFLEIYGKGNNKERIHLLCLPK